MTEDPDDQAVDAARTKKNRRLTYALVGALVLSVTITFIYKAMNDPDADEIHWQCVPNQDRSVTCLFDVSSGSGSLCFDIVLDCGDQRHQRNVCSGEVTAGTAVSVRVTDFEPPLAADATCRPPRYLNRTTTVE